MKGETTQQFVDALAYGMEQVVSFRGRTICIQGYIEEDGLWTGTADQWEPWLGDCNLWRHRAASMNECLEAFLAAPIFDGRTFYEAEGEMEVLFA